MEIGTLLTSVGKLLEGHIEPTLRPENMVKQAIRHIHNTLNEHFPLNTSPIRMPQGFYKYTAFYVQLRRKSAFIRVFYPNYI